MVVQVPRSLTEVVEYPYADATELCKQTGS
jgi:hypothetical protein